MGEAAFVSVNPYNGEQNGAFPFTSPVDIDLKIAAANQAFHEWRMLRFPQRAACLVRLAELLLVHEAELARLICIEMGKPLSETRAEIQKSADACFYYADNAERLLRSQNQSNSRFNAEIACQPLGVIFGVFPWNFPFWQVIRFAAPSLMAGNVAVVKHAPNVPLCALKLAELFNLAGFPEGVYTNIFASLHDIERITANPLVKGVTLTGSTAAGSSLASLAAKYIKPSVLELGGSDPFIVMDSGSLDEAVATAVQSRFINTGQSCIAAKRLILHESVYAEFTEKFVNAVQALKSGDPMDVDTKLGPLARPDLVQKLEKQVNDSIAMGAKVLCGARRDKQGGNFYEATVLADIPLNSPARKEELFGPVACVFAVKNEEEAIGLANDTSFGLGATVWASDFDMAARIAQSIECGNVHINSLMRSSIDFPFGGIKGSGYGRELSEYGIREFVNIKTIAWPLNENRPLQEQRPVPE